MRSLDYITVTGKRQAGARSAPPPSRAGGGWVRLGSGFPFGGMDARSARALAPACPQSNEQRGQSGGGGDPAKSRNRERQGAKPPRLGAAASPRTGCGDAERSAAALLSRGGSRRAPGARAAHNNARAVRAPVPRLPCL